MSHQVIVSKGIYHGLPTYADSLNGLTVIVTGANGISGDHMVCDFQGLRTLKFSLAFIAASCAMRISRALDQDIRPFSTPTQRKMAKPCETYSYGLHAVS